MADAGAVALGSAYGDILVDMTGTENSLNRAFDSIGGRFERFFGNIGGRMQRLGQSMTVLTAPLLGFGLTGIRVAANFDDAMREIQARTGATADEMDALRERAIQMGADTVFSATESANAMLQLLTSGMNAQQALIALPEIMNLAAAAGTNLGNTSDWVTDIMAQFQLEVDDAANVVDALVRASGSGSATVTDLAMGFQNAGGTANNFGLSVEETAAILQIFSENGIKGAEAGTQLKSMLIAMSRDTNDVQGMWKQLGISMYDADGNMRAMTNIIADLDQAMGDMTEEERIRAIQTLAGSFGQAGLSALLAEGSLYPMMDAMYNAADAATVADARMGGWNGAVESLMGSLETLQITVLTPLINNTLVPFVNRLTEIVNKVNEWAQANPELAGNLVAVLGVVTLLGPVLVILGTTISNAATVLSTGLFPALFLAKSGLSIVTMAIPLLTSALGLLFSPIGLLIAAVGLLYLAWDQNFLGIQDSVNELIERWRPFVEEMIGTVGDIISAFRDGDWQSMLTKVQELATQLQTFVTDTAVPQIQEAVGNLQTAFVEWVNEVWPQVLPLLLTVYQRVRDWVLAKAPQLIEKLGEWGAAFVDWVVPAAAELLLELPGLIADVLKWILDVTPDIVVQLLEWAAAFIDWVGPIIADLLVELAKLSGSVINWILTEWIPAVAAEIPGVVVAFLVFVQDLQRDVPPALLDLLTTIVSTIVNDLVPGVATAALEIGKSLFNGIVDGVQGIGDALFNAVKAEMDAIDDLELIPGSGISLSNVGGFLGLRALGGPVERGMPYIVGERGPELFVPNQSGEIIPNNQLGPMAAAGGAGGVSVGAIYLQVTPDMVRDPVIRQNAERLGQEFKRAIQKDGGGLAGANS
jgi:TP901 family phage tail tape measure protein